MSNFLNKVRAGHLKAVTWITENPAKTMWFAVAAILVTAAGGLVF